MRWPDSKDKSQLIDNIRQDFVAFSLFPRIDIQEEGKGYIGLSWENHNGQQNVRISLRDLLVTPKNSTKKYTYREYLASEEMADMPLLADMISRITTPPKTYIDLDSTVTDEEGFEKTDALDLIDEVLNDTPYDSTNLVFVRAPAGCGKTQTMLKMTVDRANKLKNGELNSENAWLYLYVDAQGKALANINEVLALCLDDLRVKLTYRSVAVLTRNNLLVPIIDGFDELIGSGGYADAFGSLSTLLSSLERDGSVVATGRSTFYDMHVLRVISNKYEAGESLDYTLRSIEINPWSKDKILTYFKRTLEGEELEAANIVLDSVTTENFELITKPFYAARLVDSIKAGTTFNYKDNLLDQVMGSFLDREVNKFKNRLGKPILGRREHEKIMMLVAEEMWWSEKRSVDNETIQEYAALVGEEVATSPEDIEMLKGKMDSYALIKTDTAQEDLNWFKFEHDVYYDYFLLNSLINHLNDVDAQLLKSFLTRSLLGES